MGNVLHIFAHPDFREDLVDYLAVPEGGSITAKVLEFRREGMPLPCRTRDEMFAFIAHPSVRAKFADIIVHADAASKWVLDTVVTVTA